MAANIRFYAKNIFDGASSISVTSADSNYPASNMQHAHRTLRWHSTSLAEQYVRWDVGAGGKMAGYIAVINPNVTSGNLIVRTTNNANYVADLLLNESFAVSPHIFGYGQDKYGEHGYGGTLLTTEIGRYTPGGRVLIYHFTAGLIGARYWSLIIPASCGSEDAYYAIGKIFCGLWYEPTYNIVYNYTLRPIDDSIVNESEGGQPWLDIHPKRRELEFTFQTVKKTEAHYNMFDMMYYYGKRNDIIACVYPDGTEEEKMFNTIYGRFVNPPGISRPLPTYYSIPGSIIFRESL